MFVTTAYYSTRHGAKYMAQLCKHFAHKVASDWDEHRGSVALPSGPAAMHADADGLRFRIEAPDAKSMIQSRYVIDSHLATFAHREAFTGLIWTMEPAGA